MTENNRGLTERIALSGVSYIIVTVAGFLGTVYFARVLGAGPLGVFALGLGIIKWLRVTDLGVESAMEKRLSEGNNRGSYLTAALILELLLATVVVTLLFVFGGQVNSYMGGKFVGVIALLYISDHFVKTVIVQSIRGCQRVHISEGLKALERVLRVLFQVALIFLGYEVLSLFIGMILSVLTISGIGIVYIIKYTDLFFAKPSLNEFRSLYSFSKYSVFGSVKSQVFAWIDIIILGFFVVDAQIGIYNVTWTLAMTFLIAGYAIRSNFFPEISSISTEGDRDRVGDLFGEGLLYSSLFPIPGFVGALLLAPSILNIYGTEFQAGATVLILLLFASLIRSYDGLITSVLYGLDRPELAFKMTVVFIVTNVTLNVALIWQYGIVGAAVATIVAIGASLLTGWWLASSVIDMSFPYRELSKQVFASIVMGVVVMGLKQFLVPEQLLQLAVIIGVGGVVYFTVLLSLSTIMREKFSSIVNQTPI